jgi:two-component system nitrogen regulation response regulator GlnG
MPNVLLITSDKNGSLPKELARALPKGYRLSHSLPGDVLYGGDLACLVFDLDSVDVSLIKEYSRKGLVLAVTGQEHTGHVMEAAISGAYEIMRRPLDRQKWKLVLHELRELTRELDGAVDILKDAHAPAEACVIIGRSSMAMDLCEKVARIAQVDVPVLVTGDTGTGKELVAESIARLSSRDGKPFVVINAAAVPEALLESELFGHERGAFTGAVVSKEGMLKTADNGCVFFDEIGELPLPLQGKLLRFLQTQTFYPVGSTREVHVNVRVISATNRDLTSMIRQGTFREDLYHRLRVAEVHVPPLRERKKDIQPLVQCLFYRHAKTARKPIHGVTKAFMERLYAYDWPGNIRELENTIRSAIAVCKTDYLTTHDLRDLGSPETSVRQVNGSTDTLAAALVPMVKNALDNGEKNIYDKVLADVDKHILEYLMSRTSDNQTEAARLLGINRLTLRKKLGIQK